MKIIAVLLRIISPFLRVGQVAFAAVVAGIIGHYLDSSPPTHPTHIYARWVYTIIVAGISVLLSLVWLIPFSSTFYTYPIDLLLSLAWFTAFALLINYNRSSASACAGAANNNNNNRHAFNWGGLTGGGLCNRFRAAQAFSFLSAIFWLASTLLGVWFTQSERVKRWRKQRHGDPRRGGMMNRGS